MTLTDGTGIVHIAPAFGEDDANVGRKYDLPFVQLVDAKGDMAPETPFAGKFVKDADPLVLKDLKERGLLFSAPAFEHSYPHCWRCGTPLIYYARESWFIKMTAVKEDLIRNNNTINWVPDSIGKGRFGDWLENIQDWGLSRNRYWGTPLNIWECECGHQHSIGSIEELKSISAAAKRLYISQPTLSQFLKKYEDDLGYPIFIRTKQGLKLTREGAVFLDTAREILRLERDMRNRLADQAGAVSGAVIFAVSAQRAPFLMPQVLPEFYRKYPQVTVEIVEGRTKDLEEKLQKGTIDLGILVPPLSDSGICCEVFMDEEILLAVPKGMELPANVHREPGRIPWVDPAGLAECPFLLYDINNRLHDFAVELFSRYGFKPANQRTYRNLTLIARLASAGLGITFLPETFADPSYRLDYYSIGEEGCFRPLALGFPSAKYRSGAVARFAELLKETLLAEQRAFRGGSWE